MYKAFQGANGWYVAFERADGFHHESQYFGDYHDTEQDARKEAARRNAEQAES